MDVHRIGTKKHNWIWTPKRKRIPDKIGELEIETKNFIGDADGD